MMRTNRGIGGLAVTAVAVGVLLAGSGAAFADTSPPAAPPATSSGAPAPPAGEPVCTKRIPALLSRIDKLTARINGDASTRGSTAWLKAKADKARAAGHTAGADLLDARAAARAARLDRLAQLRTQIQGVQSKDCPA
jgi:hypothetical protein